MWRLPADDLIVMAVFALPLPMSMPSPDRNLIIVHTPRRQALDDFTGVKTLIAERAPEIDVFILANRHRHSVMRRQAATRPTLVFCPFPMSEFSPVRGKIYADRRFTKIEEQQRLAAAGLPVPRTSGTVAQVASDPSWGQFVVVKPALYSVQGRNVVLVRRIDLPRLGSNSATPASVERQLLVQEFIDTGPFAESHRVMTVLGRPVYSIVSRSLTARPELSADDQTVLPIASNAGPRALELNFEKDVIDLAREASRAFAELPVLGVDVIREASTGRLFVLEVNPGVGAWHISSTYAEAQRREFNLDLHGQFGALDIIADALIDVTRREAE